MRFRLLSAVFAFCLVAAAQQTLTIQQLVSFIKSAKELKQSDREIAGFLSHVKLTEKLDDRTIETLEGMGIGTKTMQALESLKDHSQALTAAAPILPEPKARPIPIPNSEEQA